MILLFSLILLVSFAYLLISFYQSSHLQLINSSRTNLINNFGEKIFFIIKLKSLNKIEILYRDLYLDINKLYSSIALIVIYSLSLIIVKAFKLELISLILSAGVIFETIKINFNIYKQKKDIETKLYHFISCLEVLCLKNQSSLLKALIEIELNSDHKFSHFIKRIISEASNSNAHKIDEFIPVNIKYSDEIKSILRRISSHSDTENLGIYFQELKNKINLDQKLEQDDLLENIQLYLSIPVIAMMLLASYPLYSAILFSIKGILN